MKGYWQNDAETARALVPDPADPDGAPWLHTGDIGKFDDRGRIVITDRKKDLIVNDKGDNVAPQKLEGMLTLQPEIGQAMVAGDKRPYVVGLIVPDAEWAFEWARENGVKFDMPTLQDMPPFRAAIRAVIDRVNAELSVVEKVRQFCFRGRTVQYRERGNDAEHEDPPSQDPRTVSGPAKRPVPQLTRNWRAIDWRAN